MVFATDCYESNLHGLASEPACGIFKGVVEAGGNVVGVEEGGSSLEGHGNAILREGHRDGSLFLPFCLFSYLSFIFSKINK